MVSVRKRTVLGQRGMGRNQLGADVAGLGDGERAAPRPDDYWQAHVHGTESERRAPSTQRTRRMRALSGQREAGIVAAPARSA